MRVSGSFQWYPERLNAAIAEAYKESLLVAEADAKATSPDPDKAGATLVGTALAPTGLGGVFEKGRRGGYAIAPTHSQALRIGTGFAEFATGGPMAPKPYIGPAAQRWAAEEFQAVARARLAASGF
jgi:hypothetical protein